MKKYSIGRDDSNDITLLHDSISRRHAELIEQGNNQYQLRDLGSTNGTFYFGKDGWAPTSFAKLEPDDMVRIGEHETSVMGLLGMLEFKPSQKSFDEDTQPSRAWSRPR